MFEFTDQFEGFSKGVFHHGRPFSLEECLHEVIFLDVVGELPHLFERSLQSHFGIERVKVFVYAFILLFLLISKSALFTSCVRLSCREDYNFSLVIILGDLSDIGDICFQRIHHVLFDFGCSPEAIALFVNECHHRELCAISTVGRSEYLVKLCSFGYIKIVCILEGDGNVASNLCKLFLVFQLDQSFRVLERSNSLKILTNY